MVRWRNNGIWVERQYPGGVSATVLPSGTGVAIAEVPRGPGSGAIYNEDGSVRVRLVNAHPEHGQTVFDSVFCEGGELTFLIRGRGISIAAVYDENGRFVRKHEAS